MIPLLVKFGGSVVTRQDSEGPFDSRNTARLAAELAETGAKCVVVHGTGLVGKPPALEHGYAQTGIIGADKQLVADRIRHSLRELNQRVVGALLAAGLPAFSVDTPPLFAGTLDRVRHPDSLDGLRDLVRNGSVPVLHGDHVPCPDGRFRILSSDTIMVLLARELKPQRAVFLTDVEGVFAAGREDAPLSELTPEILDRIAGLGNDGEDVSRGMRGKIEAAVTIAALGVPCRIASGRSPGVLNDLLQGRDRGTHVRVS